jgi:hypothetical protein
MKTVDDVTRENVIALAESLLDLVSAARMMRWLLGGDKDGDTSFADSIDKAVGALADCGLNAGTTEEFEANIEEMLDSGIRPDHWRMLKDAKGRTQ